MAAMQIPKRHHYIAETVQKRFTDGDGYLFAYDKRAPGTGIRPTRPDNVFVEGHLYSQRAADGAPDVSLELAFGELESAIDPILEKIATAARAKSEPRLSSDEKRLLDIFVYFQWKRVPDRKSLLNIDFDKSIDKSVREYETTVRPITDVERAAIKSPSEKARIFQNAWVIATGLAGKEAMEALDQRGLGIPRAARALHKFGDLEPKHRHCVSKQKAPRVIAPAAIVRPSGARIAAT
jgi:hypothetical protein